MRSLGEDVDQAAAGEVQSGQVKLGPVARGSQCGPQVITDRVAVRRDVVLNRTG